ncbi:hypothetical protein QBC45DRAFT_429119 [Copromyces sp. CBS 386.78]|nr:hypothetical protein QBC45DRAFT_429119 [Copromyces sp. CBS 386.78]
MTVSPLLAPVLPLSDIGLSLLPLFRAFWSPEAPRAKLNGFLPRCRPSDPKDDGAGIHQVPHGVAPVEGIAEYVSVPLHGPRPFFAAALSRAPFAPSKPIRTIRLIQSRRRLFCIVTYLLRTVLTLLSWSHPPDRPQSRSSAVPPASSPVFSCVPVAYPGPLFPAFLRQIELLVCCPTHT